MEETNNFTLTEKIKLFWDTWKKHNKRDRLRFWALCTGFFTFFLTSYLLIKAFIIYDPEKFFGNSTLLTSINETKAENATTYDDANQNLKNSKTDAPGFERICTCMLIIHLVISLIMFEIGVLWEWKNLLLPWMITTPTIMIGLLISVHLYPCFYKTQGWAIADQVLGLGFIIPIIFLFVKMSEYYGLLTERDRVKKASENSRPVAPDLLNETES